MINLNKSWKTQYLTLWGAQGSSLLTSSILQMSIVWHITESTSSALFLSLGMICAYLPQGILGPFIGVFVDRFQRKKVMVLSDLLIGISSLSLWVVSIFATLPLYLFFIVLIFRSIGTAFHQPAFEALIATIVPKEQLTKFAGYSQGFKSISLILSPALGAMFYSFWGLNIVILLDFFAAIIAIFLLNLLTTESINKVHHLLSNDLPAEKKHFLKETLEGVTILKKTKAILPLVIIGSIYALFYIPIGSLFPFITMIHFNGSISQVGLVEIFYSSGTLVGAFLLAKSSHKLNKVVAISLSIFFYGAAVALSGVIPTYAILFFMFLSFLMGLAAPFFFGIQTALFQILLPHQYLGRAFSVNNSLRLLAMPISLTLSGAAVELIGVDSWFLGLGCLSIILSIIAYFSLRKAF